MALKKISFVTNKAIEPIIRKWGFVQTKIITDWPEIVGADLGSCSLPAKLINDSVLPKKQILIVEVNNSAKATELAYLEDIIISRINTYFGYDAISQIKIKQTPTLIVREKNQKKSLPLSEQQIDDLNIILESIEDEELKTALFELGKSIKTDPA